MHLFTDSNLKHIHLKKPFNAMNAYFKHVLIDVVYFFR